MFCGRHLLAAKLRPSDIDASAGSVEQVERIVRQIRARWPYVRILLRADSGFARETLMAWCEQNRVNYVFGLARNARLVAMIEQELAAARAMAERTGRPARRFKDFQWSTHHSWSRRRRVIETRGGPRRSGSGTSAGAGRVARRADPVAFHRLGVPGTVRDPHPQRGRSGPPPRQATTPLGSTWP